MMKIYNQARTLTPIRIAVIMLFLCGSISAQDQINSDQTLTFDGETKRIPFSSSQNEEIITLCGLDAGTEYYLMITAFLQPNCLFQIDIYNEEGVYSTVSNESIDLTEELVFTATDACMQFHIYNENCTGQKDLPLDLSISPTSCAKPDDVEKSVAVLSTDNSYSVTELIEDVFIGGGCFDVTNIQLIGNAAGVGYVNNGTTNVMFDDGVILSSGNIANAEGPNTSPSDGNSFGDNSGDPDLNLLGAGSVRDAVGIEFDFTPTVPVINFEYVFGSEEYCEFVNSTFNDVFGFFISGPGINGPFTLGAENIALVPGTANYVAINSVNHLTNTAYFNPNSAASCGSAVNIPEIEYDGYTTVLTATANVIPCSTYHIRMVVSDIGDNIYDSGVFLKANGFDAGGQAEIMVDIPSIGIDGIAYEGCSSGMIIFERDPDSDLSLPFIVDFEILASSTATEGVDYSSIPNPVIIPAGQSSVSIPFDVFDDGITEGLESVFIELANPCSCSGSTAQIDINDLIPLEVTLDSLIECGSAATTLTPGVIGGVPDVTYQWSDGSTGTSIDVNTTIDETYSVTVTDMCGTTAEATGLVQVVPNSTADLVGDAAVCDENTMAELEINFTGTGPWEIYYTHDGVLIGPISGITENPYILVIDGAGVYELFSLTDDSGVCPGDVSGTVVVDNLEISLLSSVTDPMCADSDDGTIIISGDGGQPDYTYLWDTGETDDFLIDLGPGSYTVTTTDANGCTYEETFTINPAPVITSSIAATGDADCTTPAGGSADLTVSGGTPGYTFEWSDGTMTEDITDLGPGTYTVTITDLNGCTEENTVDISGDFTPPVAVANVNGLIDCNGGSATISGSGSSSNTGPTVYEWYLNGVLVSTDQTFTVTEAGTYDLIITDSSNGCTADASVTVATDLNEPNAAAVANGVIDCNNSAATLDGSGSTGNGTLVLEWFSGGTSIGTGTTIDVTTGGTYILIVTDQSNGCTSEVPVTIDEDLTPPTPIILDPPALDCNVTEVTLDGSTSIGDGTATYEWFNGGTSLGTGTDVTVTGPGNYTLIITNGGNGCTAEVSASVTQDITPPPANINSQGDLTCTQGSTVLSTDQNGNTYEWQDGSGGSLGSDPSIEVTTPGTYVLVVTGSGNGCTAEASIDVGGDFEPPSPVANVNGLIDCTGGSATISGSGSSSNNGANEYAWYLDGVLVSTDETFDVTEVGTYELILTDGVNGCTSAASVTVDSNMDEPVASAVATGFINCINDEGTIDGSGSSGNGTLILEWYDDAGNLVSTGDNLIVTDGGTYVLIVTDQSNGCTSQTEISIDADLIPPIPDILDPLALDCITTEVTLDGSGSIADPTATYQWYSGGTPVGNGPVINVTDPGNYNLVITNGNNGCTAELSTNVIQDILPPPASINPADDLTCDQSSVIVSTNESGTFEWQDGSGGSLGSNPSIEVTTPGTYILIVTSDLNGCTAEATIDVNENIVDPVAATEGDGIIDCNSATTQLSGGGSSTGPDIIYEWYNEFGVLVGTSIDLDVDEVGNYTLLVTDTSNGCTSEAAATVTADTDLPDIAVDIPANLDCITSVSTLFGSTNTTGNIQVGWYEGGSLISNTASVDVTEPGVYTFIVTNATSGCTSEETVEILQDIDEPIPFPEVLGIINCLDQVAFLIGELSEPFGFLDYEWTDASGNVLSYEPNFEVDQAGTYTLFLTNIENGCTSEMDIVVEEDIQEPTPQALPDGIITCLDDMVSIDGSGSNGIGTISYEWTLGGSSISTNPQIDVNAAGTYTLIITDDANGCTSTMDVTVDENIEEPTPQIDPAALLDCVNESVTLNAGGSTGNGTITIEWQDGSGGSIGTGSTIDVNTPGTYIVVVTNDENGCTATTSVTVDQNVEIPVPTAATDGILTCVNEEVNLTGSATGNGTIVYEWQDGSGGSIGTDNPITVTTPGTYILVATNQVNGCTETTSVVVDENLDTPDANAGPDNNLTCDVSEVTLDGSGSSAGGNVTYEWLNAGGVTVSTDVTANVTEVGTYTLIVTNGTSGCTALSTATVTPDVNLPTADAGLPQLLDCNVSVVTISGAGSSTGPGFEYEWFDPNDVSLGSDVDVDVSTPGTYVILITNTANGCTSTASVQVSEDLMEPPADAGLPQLLNCDVSTVTLDGSNSEGTTYEWTDPNGTVISNETTVDVALPGSYQILVTGANGCTAIASVDVAVDTDLPVADPGISELLTCTQEMVTLGGSQTSTGPTITYEWLDENGTVVGTDITLDVTTAGTYTLNVYNTANDCDATGEVVVDLNQDYPVADPGLGDILTCELTEVTLGGPGTTTGNEINISWQNSSGQEVGTDPELTVTEPGTYTIIVTNSTSNCITEATVDVGIDIADPVADAGSPQMLTCDVTSVTLDGTDSDGATYEWTDPNGTVVGNTNTVDVILPGTYQILVTGDNGCTAVASVDVAVDANLPVADPGASALLTCTEDMVTLGGTQTTTGPTIEYEWLNENGTVVGTDLTLDVTIAGTYTLNVYNTANDCDATGDVVVDLDQAYPEADPGVGDILTCNLTEVTIGGPGTTTGSEIEISWQNANGQQVGTDPELIVDQPGTYTIIVTNTTNSCVTEATVDVGIDMDDPLADAGENQLLDCESQNVTLDGSASTTNSGTLNYEWTNPSGIVISSEVSIDVVEAGTYELLITAENGCTSIAEVEVNLDAEIPLPAASNDGILTCVNEVVNLNGTATGGGTLVYEWTDASGLSLGTDNPIAVTTPGVYTLNVLNSDNGCSGITTVEVTENLDTPTALAGPDNILTCDVSTVALDGAGSSTGGNVTYEWQNAGGVTVSTEITANVSEIGIYTIIVTNGQSGCTSTATVEVTPDVDLPLANAGLPQVLNCDVSLVTLSSMGSSTGGTITSEWFDPSNASLGTALDIDVTTPGTYTLLITNTFNGCTATASVSVEEDLLDPIADAGSAQLLNCAVSMVTLNGSASDGVSFEWTNPAGTVIGDDPMVDVDEPGTYQLQITGANGCVSLATVDVALDEEIPVADPGLGGLLTCVEDMITLGGANTSTGADIVYEWLDENNQIVGTTPTLDVITPGTYTLNVYNTYNSCDATNEVVVNEDQDYPEVDPGIAEILNCDILEVQLGGAGTTTGPTILYSWEDATGTVVGDELEIQVGAAGTYTLYVTNTINNCVSSASIEIEDDLLPPLADAGQDQLIDCNTSTVSLDGSGSIPNTGGLSYQWTNTGGVIVGTTPTIMVDQAGTYELIVTGDNGCTALANVDVDLDAEVPVADGGPGGTLDCLVDLITLGGSGTSTGATVTYEWLDENDLVVGTTPTLDVTISGVYTLIVYNSANNCNSSADVLVDEDQDYPIVDPGIADVLTCDLTEVTLGGTGTTSGPTIEYSWLDENGIEVGTELELTVADAGVYTLIVTNTINDCVTIGSVEIFDNLLAPTANAGLDQLITCDITTVNLDGSGSVANTGDLDYEWTNAGGVVVGTTAMIDVAEAGVYQLLITGDNGCTAIASVEVNVDSAVPTADAGPGGLLNCDVDLITLGGSSTSTGPTITYEWTNAANQVVSTDPTFDTNTAGVYTLTVFNTANNCDISSSVEVFEDLAQPVADPGIGGMLTCDLLSIMLGGGNTSTGTEIIYSWENEIGVVVGTDLELEVTTPGTYTLIVNNTTNGCATQQSVTIPQDIDGPVADAGAPSILTCEITSVALDGSGSSTGSGFTYEWYNAANVLISTDIVPSVSDPDNYTLIVTNTSNGCTSVSNVEVTPDDNLPTAIAATPGLLTCTVQSVTLNGTASSSVSGMIEYQWLDGTMAVIADTSLTDVSQPGTYTLIITDPTNGCTTTTTVEVPQNIDVPEAFAGETDTITCDVTMVSLNGSGNGNNLSYEWFNDSGVSISTASAIDVSSIGLYTLVVTDGINGCTALSEVAVVPDDNIPLADAGIDALITCATTQVVLDATGSTTGANITYEWISPSGVSLGSDPLVTVSESGLYTFIVYDSANDCSSQDEVFVDENVGVPFPDIIAIGASSITCITSAVVLDGSSSGPFGDLIFAWSTTDGNITTATNLPQIEGDQPGTYTLLVTNTINGCTEEVSFDVGVDLADPVAIVADPPAITCDVTEFNLNANGSSAGNFEYSWTSNPAGGISSGQGTLAPVITQPGTYTLMVTNPVNGCTSDVSVTVDENTELPDAAANVTELLDCVTESVNLSGAGSSTGSNFTYQWSGASILNGATSLNPEVNLAGNYVLLVTDTENGCTETATIDVEENTNVPVDLNLDPTPPLCYGDDGSIGVVAVTGGEGPYTYSLDGDNFFADTMFMVPPGNSTVYVQDAIGCMYEESIYVQEVQPVGVELDANLTIELGEDLQLLATTNIPDWLIDTIMWTPADSLSCTNCLDPIANPTSTTTYTVTVVNDKGCEDMAEIRVEVQKDRDIYIPNAFSPNGDGINDFFLVFSDGESVKQINELHVYTRWGEEVFENSNFSPDDETHGWDGSFMDELLNPAVFVYWCEIEFVDGFVKLYKGDVTIVK